jgi:glycosyltransferase involved in cell wall biosynthesis
MKNSVLLSAIACDPNMGSEAYVGWNWLQLTLRCTDEERVILLTRKMHVDTVLAGLSPEQAQRTRVLGFDIWGLANMDHRHRLMKLYYVFWQLAALFYIAGYQARHRSIAVIHHCTYNVVDMPGFLWMIPGTAFIWGPVGGGQVPPAWSRRVYGRSWLKQRWRTLMKRTIRINPLVYLASLCARRIYVANADTLAVLPAVARGKSVPMLETAVAAVRAPAPAETTAATARFDVLWVGQLEPRKAVVILLDALVHLRHTQPRVFELLRVSIVGSGPDAAAVHAAIHDARLEQTVHVMGAISYAEVQALYQHAQAFVFTSVQDTSGNVLLEALSNGVPAIAFNHQGAREILSDGGGLLLDVDSYEAAVEAVAEALTRLTTQPELRSRLAEEAICNVRKNFLWGQKEQLHRKTLDELFPQPILLEDA